LPEVSLVAILDADKEGFLRSRTALIQTSGRAARNANGIVLMYAKRVTDSMKFTIETTQKRRETQMAYNKKHGITPKTTLRDLDKDLKVEDAGELYNKASKLDKMPKAERQQLVKELKAKMLVAAKNLDFEDAARYRDEIAKVKKL
jgi:excinuclease ABC subunit B